MLLIVITFEICKEIDLAFIYGTHPLPTDHATNVRAWMARKIKGSITAQMNTLFCYKWNTMNAMLIGQNIIGGKNTSVSTAGASYNF
jgi:hypothetical protein